MNVKKMENYVSHVLRFGVLLCGSLSLLGLSLLAWTGDASCPYGVIDLQWLLHGDPFWSPSHILFLGFIVLVGTPLLRVASSTVAYGLDHDWIFMAITGTVLIVLVIGILLGVG
ncbi:DUF1634 domain-containing protein [Candidatus Bathyarchaeota archaeon]|nr:DUF1634 domain-containing protein [Candidatus Bathyarchaeota archaeon]